MLSSSYFYLVTLSFKTLDKLQNNQQSPWPHIHSLYLPTSNPHSRVQGLYWGANHPKDKNRGQCNLAYYFNKHLAGMGVIT